MTDYSSMHLGKRPAQLDPRTVRLSEIMHLLPASRVKRIDWGRKLDKPKLSRFLNNKIGCCTCSAVGALIEIWSAWTKPSMTILPDNTIGDLYRDACGWVPGNHSTDNIGGIIADVMEYWRRHPVGGHTLDAHASIDPSNLDQMRDAIWYFGGVNIGIELPLAWQTMPIWDRPSNAPYGNAKPGSWGGHDVILHMHDSYSFKCLTWGEEKIITNAGLVAYCSEAHAPVSKEWLMNNGVTPSDVDYSTLINYLNRLR